MTHTSPGGVDPEHMIGAIIAGVDHVASEHERRWGRGRLRLLVSDLLRAKFDAQAAKLDAALQSGQVLQIQIHADAMRRAWQVLDRAATEAGCEPLSPEVWECVLPASGEVVAIVRGEAEASLVAVERPVFTMREVAQAIELLGKTTLEAKRTFGASVAAVRAATIDWGKGDEIPF